MVARPNCMSVLILTMNEEINLPVCLGALEWSDDIVVLDSFSSDTTEKVAKARGVRFVQRPFDNYAAQRNYGLNEIPYKHNWLLMVDADEVVPNDLVDEMMQQISKENDAVALYRMRRKDHFMGKWIKRSSGYPTWFGRLMKIGAVCVKRDINEEYVTDGEVGYLKNHLLHYPFNKGFSAWLEKHNRYSTMEAELIIRGDLVKPALKDFFSKDPAMRRRSVKGWVYRMPGRPLLMFLGMYFGKRGFLDGRAGLTFCLLRAMYEFLINCKVKELQLRGKSLPL